MTTTNPYQPPAATVADAPDPYQPVSLFSLSGRIGRARYLIYCFWGFFGYLLVNGIFYSWVIAIAIGLVVLALFLTLSVQRAHDCNRSAWFAIVALIPLVNLFLLFKPGTHGTNHYGARPPPNSVAVLIVAGLTALFAAFIVLAALNQVLTAAQSAYSKRTQPPPYTRIQ